MSMASKRDLRILSLKVSRHAITARLADGRTISVPLAWSWRLTDATPAQRAKYEITGNGEGVHWPDIDEDISAQGMLQGTPAPRPKRPKDTLLNGQGKSCYEVAKKIGLIGLIKGAPHDLSTNKRHYPVISAYSCGRPTVGIQLCRYST